MKAANIIITAAIIMCCLWGTTAWGTPVTIPYEFVRDESNLRLEGVWGMPTYSIEGTFTLSFDLDLDIASFDQVNATISDKIAYWETYGQQRASWTNNLDVLFKLTELESVYVTDMQIDFYFDRNLPGWEDSDIRLSVTFVGDSLNMTGYFSAPVYDGPAYYLNAVAVEVPEPATILMLCSGGLLIRRKNL